MVNYVTKKPRVYIEAGAVPTVISHLVARPSNDTTLASWQRASQQLWEDYTDQFEFVISDIVLAETSVSTIFIRNKEGVMRDLNTVFCHQHSHSQPRYPHFTLCPYCREDAPHEAIVVEAAVNYFSSKLRDFFIQTELEIQMGADKRRADIVLVDGKQNHAAIVECKRIGVQADGIDQLKSYLCATDTPLGVFANSTDPEDWEYFENLGRNRFKDIASNLFWKCIQDPSEAESSQPATDAETYYKRGLEKYKLGQYDAAIADFDNAIQLKPNYIAAYFDRGLAKANIGEYAATIVDYDKVIQLKPDYAEAYYYRGLAKAGIGERAAAIVDYDKVIQLKPDYAEAYYYRGLAKAGIGERAAAIVDYDKVIQLKPDMPRLITIADSQRLE